MNDILYLLHFVITFANEQRMISMSVNNVCVSIKDLDKIKDMSASFFFGAVPKNLTQEQLQIWLICQGFVRFLMYKKVLEPGVINFHKCKRDG